MLEDLDEEVDVLDVVIHFEVDEVGLPELLRVDRGPAEVLTTNLGAPLVERRELLVVLVEVVAQVLELLSDFLVNPRAVPKLDDQVEHVDH